MRFFKKKARPLPSDVRRAFLSTTRPRPFLKEYSFLFERRMADYRRWRWLLDIAKGGGLTVRYKDPSIIRPEGLPRLAILLNKITNFWYGYSTAMPGVPYIFLSPGFGRKPPADKIGIFLQELYHKKQEAEMGLVKYLRCWRHPEGRMVMETAAYEVTIMAILKLVPKAIIDTRSMAEDIVESYKLHRVDGAEEYVRRRLEMAIHG